MLVDVLENFFLFMKNQHIDNQAIGFLNKKF